MTMSLLWNEYCDASIARGEEPYMYSAFCKEHRECYGPLACKHYKMGPTRSVPYKGFSGVKDEGWLDEICVQWRTGGDE